MLRPRVASLSLPQWLSGLRRKLPCICPSRLPSRRESWPTSRLFLNPVVPRAERSRPLSRGRSCGPAKMAAFLTHQQKVLRLYKRALRHLESWCIFRDRYRFFACLMRARFDEHKDEKDMVKATKLLMAGEHEFWENQHPQPYIFPDSPEGTSYERYDTYKAPEWLLEYWHPSEKAVYPDYFAKREQWKRLRMESWEKEVQQLQEETPLGGPLTEALPPARKPGHLPPLWWDYVTAPRERPM